MSHRPPSCGGSDILCGAAPLALDDALRCAPILSDARELLPVAGLSAKPLSCRLSWSRDVLTTSTFSLRFFIRRPPAPSSGGRTVLGRGLVGAGAAKNRFCAPEELLRPYLRARFCFRWDVAQLPGPPFFARHARNRPAPLEPHFAQWSSSNSPCVTSSLRRSQKKRSHRAQ